MKLTPTETILTETWVLNNGMVESDEVGKRIQWLISECLKKITTHENGWNVLYQDSDDKRYWELTYPNSGWHGGGNRQLIHISNEEVKNKYNFFNQHDLAGI
jgi:hypothetical protein